MKDIWLIRHAESLANIGEPTTTPREIPLSPQGLVQADKLAESIAIKPDLIVLSSYDRAVRTAEPLIGRFRDVPVETLNVHEFTYLSITRSRGTNSAQRRPWTEEYWNRSDPNYCDGGQSESFAEFIARVEEFVRVMHGRSFRLAFVFTHEQVIKALIWQAMRFADRAVTTESMAGFYHFMKSFKIPNISILRSLMDDDGALYFGEIDSFEER